MKINISNFDNSAHHGHDKEESALSALLMNFAANMGMRLSEKKAVGRGGWDDAEGTPTRFLELKLQESFEKGNMVDVANYAMFIWNRQN